MEEKQISYSEQQLIQSTEAPKTSTYGKRPLWQWILLYLVIGGIIYAGIYYFFLKNKGYNYPYPSSEKYQQITTPTISNKETVEKIQGWKTYASDNYHFSFQYPPTWNLEASGLDKKTKSESITISEFKSDEPTKQGYSINVNAFPNYELFTRQCSSEFTFAKKLPVHIDGRTFEKVYMDTYKDFEKNEAEYDSIIVFNPSDVCENTTTSNMDYLNINGKSFTIGLSTPLTFNSPGGPAQIRVALTDPVAQKYDAIFDQMLSTIKFIN